MRFPPQSRILIAVLIPVAGPARADVPPTGAGQVHALTAAEAGRGQTVLVRGVVTYSNPQLRQVYIQDETGGVLVRHTAASPTPAPGQRVAAVGKTAPIGGRGSIEKAELTFLGPAELPAPVDVRPEDWPKGAATGRLVTVRGVVRHAYTNEFGRFTFDLAAGRTSLPVWFREPGLEADSDQYVGATVVVRGVLNPHPDGRLVLLAQSPLDGNVRIERPAEAVTDLRPVRANALAAEAGRRVRVVGRVGAGEDPQTFVLTDRTGAVTVYPVDPAPRLEIGERAEAVGFVTDGAVKFAVVRALVPDPGRAGVFVPVIHTTRELRRLPPAEAARQQPVRLRGLATHVGLVHKDFFLQDATGAVYVDGFGSGPPPRPGDFVELTGVTGAGSFTNEVDRPTVRVLAPSKLPGPEPVSAADVVTGRLDARWVVVEGVVQHAREERGFLVLKLMTRFGGIDYRLPGTAAVAEFVDARVRAAGVYVAIHNNDRRAYGFRLYAPGPEHLQVVVPAHSDPFTATAYAVNELLRYDPAVEDGRRVRVAGTVTAVIEDGAFYLQDGTGGVLVRPVPGTAVRIGDAAQVAGFVEKDGPTAVLADAVVGQAPVAPPPEPVAVRPEDVRDASQDGRLVRVEGQFIEEVGDEGSRVLQMADGPRRFAAVLPRAAGRDLPPSPDAHSKLALVGVLQVQGEGRPGTKEFRVQGFRIVLRSAADVTVLEHPPWWTVGRYQAFVIGIGALLGICVMGLYWLRRRVRRQTDQIRDALVTEARLEARYRQLIEGANDVIFRLDAAGRVADWNAAGERLLGRPRSAVVGRPLSAFVEPGREGGVADLQGEGPATRELVLRSAAGRPVTLEVTTRMLPDGAGGGIEAIARDVTERRGLEERLRQAAKMQAIGHLAGGVAHDFNNLLTVINGNCDLIVRQTDPTDPRRGLLDEVRTAGQKAAGVTRQLLAFGRQTVVAPRVLDLNDLLRDLAPVLTRLLGEQVTVSFQFGADLPPVRVDGPSVEQVVLNLIVNARDAMPGGGTVIVATEDAGDSVRMTVTDTGVGMDAATRARLFEPYFTTKGQGKGTGLGLAVVLGVVDQAGGRIDVETAPGHGTTFSIEFPAASADSFPGTLPVPPSVLSPADSHRVILLVEDEPAVQLLEKRVLESGKYEVLVASSGEEALTLLEGHAGRIDLLVTDVIMPGMSGRELAEEVATRRPGMPALFLSGYTPDDVLRQGVEASATHFLQKPFSPGSLLKKVREVLAPQPG